MNKVIPTDALVTPQDVSQIKAEINRRELQQLVHRLAISEPEIAVLIAEQNAKIFSLLDETHLPSGHVALFRRYLALVTWTPLILLDRAHRREWNDFLPSENTEDQSGQKGGAA
jgi:hypothetical protein